MGEARRRKKSDPHRLHSKEEWTKREIIAYSIEKNIVYCTGEILLEKAIAKAQERYPRMLFEYQTGGLIGALNKVVPKMRGLSPEIESESRW